MLRLILFLVLTATSLILATPSASTEVRNELADDLIFEAFEGINEVSTLPVFDKRDTTSVSDINLDKTGNSDEATWAVCTYGNSGEWCNQHIGTYCYKGIMYNTWAVNMGRGDCNTVVKHCFCPGWGDHTPKRGGALLVNEYRTPNDQFSLISTTTTVQDGTLQESHTASLVSSAVSALSTVLSPTPTSHTQTIVTSIHTASSSATAKISLSAAGEPLKVSLAGLFAVAALMLLEI